MKNTYVMVTHWNDGSFTRLLDSNPCIASVGPYGVRYCDSIQEIEFLCCADSVCREMYWAPDISAVTRIFEHRIGFFLEQNSKLKQRIDSCV